MRIEKCYFCGFSVYPGHGSHFVRNDGKVFILCSSKCMSHFKKKHNPRKNPWGIYGRAARGKELIMETTMQMEQKRNNPKKYDRETVSSTIKAMKRIAEVRQRRRERFVLHRHMENKSLRERNKISELSTGIDLIRNPKMKEHAQKAVEKAAEKIVALKEKIKVERRAADMDEGDDENVEKLDEGGNGNNNKVAQTKKKKKKIVAPLRTTKRKSHALMFKPPLRKN